jgi:hypothetical protein
MSVNILEQKFEVVAEKDNVIHIGIINASTGGDITDGANLGNGAGIFAYKYGSVFAFKSLTSSNNLLDITFNANEIDFSVNPTEIIALITPLIPTKTSDLINDSGFINDISGKENVGVAQGIMDAHNIAFDHSLIATAIQTELDPVWNSEKGNYYTKSESDDTFQPIGTYVIESELVAIVDYHNYSLLNQNSDVVLEFSNGVRIRNIINGNGHFITSLSTNDDKTASLPDKSGTFAFIEDIPTALSELSDDATHRLVTDTDISNWNAKADIGDIPTQLSQLTDDSTHRLVTDIEKNTWNAKQDAIGYTPEQVLTFSNGLTRTLNEVKNNLITGIAGGQTIIGGTQNSENLNLSSNSAGTKGLITADSNLKLLQNGANATGFADQKNSNVLTFESSRWNGSAEAKGVWNIFAEATSTTADRSDLRIKMGTNVAMYFTGISGVPSTIFINQSTQLATTTATTTGLSASTSFSLRNLNTTINNYSVIRHDNAGGMVTAGLLFRNVSHDPTTGSSNLEIHLANGATVRKVWEYLADGTLRANTQGTATSAADQKASNTISFENSVWVSGAESKRYITVQSTTTGTEGVQQLSFIVNGALRFLIASDLGVESINGGFRNLMSSTQTSPLTTQSILQNTNTTVGNYAAISNRNAGNMFTGVMAFKNVSHSATIGAADLEIHLANGAAFAKVLDIYANGDVEITTIAAGFYFGDRATDGSWRIIRSGNNLVVERRESGNYVTKQIISA